MAVVVGVVIGLVLASFGVIYVTSQSSTAKFNFATTPLKKRGTMITSTLIGTPSVYNQSEGSILSDAAFVIFQYPANNSDDSNLMKDTSILQEEGIASLVMIGKYTNVNQISYLAKEGFNGIFLNGGKSNYTAKQLGEMVKITHNSGGFIIANMSLLSSIQYKSFVDMYYVNEPSFSMFVNEYWAMIKNGTEVSKVLFNINGLPSDFVQQDALSLLNLNISYFSLGLKSENYATMISINKGIEYSSSRPGFSPSLWSIRTSLPNDWLTHNGTMYYGESNSSSYRILGINITYGYMSFESQWVRIANNFTFASLGSLYITGTAIYSALATDLYDPAIHSIAYYLKNGTLMKNSSFLAVKRISVIPTQVITFQGSPYVAIISGIFERNQSFLFNVTAIDTVDNETTLNTSFSTSQGGGGSGPYLRTLGRDILEVNFELSSFHYDKIYDRTFYLPLNMTVLQLVNSSIVSSSFSNKTLYYIQSTTKTNPTLAAVNVITGSIHNLFGIPFSNASILRFVDNSFLITSNKSIYDFSSNGSIVWRISYPSPVSSQQYVMYPVLVGYNQVTIGLNSRSTYGDTAYSQEIELVNLTDGEITHTYYDNFTPSSSGVTANPMLVTPLIVTGNFVIYANWQYTQIYCSKLL